MTQFLIHQKVTSKPVFLHGVIMKPAFTGTVVQASLNGKGDIFYFVRDKDGEEWHRDGYDLTAAPVEEGEQA